MHTDTPLIMLTGYSTLEYKGFIFYSHFTTQKQKWFNTLSYSKSIKSALLKIYERINIFMLSIAFLHFICLDFRFSATKSHSSGCRQTHSYK